MGSSIAYWMKQWFRDEDYKVVVVENNDKVNYLELSFCKLSSDTRINVGKCLHHLREICLQYFFFLSSSLLTLLDVVQL